jgi:hypothetical protein
MRFIDEMIDRKRREADQSSPEKAPASQPPGAPPDFDRADLPEPLEWPPRAGIARSRDLAASEEADQDADVPVPRSGLFSRSGTQPGRRRSGQSRPAPADDTLSSPQPRVLSSTRGAHRADDPEDPDRTGLPSRSAGPGDRRTSRPVSVTPLRLVDPIEQYPDEGATRENTAGALAAEPGDADAGPRDPHETDDHAPAFDGAGLPAEDAPGRHGYPDRYADDAPRAATSRPAGGFEEPAAPAPSPVADEAPASSGAGRAKTRLLGFHAPDVVQDPLARARAHAPAAPPPARFPVGWLVVEKGPGRGSAFALSDGLSTIGRGDGQTVQLDLGDTAISRDTHAAIAYDDEQRACFIGHGGKANLVRLNGRPVLATETISDGDRIRIGETTLRFVALCGPEFSWSDDADEEGPDAATL